MTDLMQFLGAMFIAGALALSPRILRINAEIVTKGSLLLLGCSIIKTLIFSYVGYVPPGMREFISMVSLPDLFFVFLEDALHTLPILLLDRIGAGWAKKLKYIFFPISILVFAFGHAYQGIQGLLITSMYIPLTYRLAKDYGLGTVMSLHIVWDVIMYFVSLLVLGAVLE